MVYSRKNKTLVALFILSVMALTLVLGACTPNNTFVPNTFIPTVESVESNGGVAVRVNATDGDWIYYVNNYQGSDTITNAYTTDIKDGQIIRIKVSDLADLVNMYYDENDDDVVLSISKALYEKAQVVVPYVVATGNTTTTVTQLKGNGNETMGYVIQLADGSFIVYDGGDASCAGQLIETLNDLKIGNDITVRAWVLTVEDDAHIGCFKEIASKNAGEKADIVVGENGQEH